MKNTIRNTLLITTAATALVAGTSLASAQGMNERREAPAAHDQKAPEGKTDQQQGSAPQKSDKVKPAPSAQAPDKVKPAPSAQAPDKAKPAPSAQAPDKAKPAPSAQAPEKPIDSKSQTTGQGGTAQPSQSPNQGAAPSAAGRERLRRPPRWPRRRTSVRGALLRNADRSTKDQVTETRRALREMSDEADRAIDGQVARSTQMSPKR
jgi:outer membrane biosynthesis protein TonB